MVGVAQSLQQAFPVSKGIDGPPEVVFTFTPRGRQLCKFQEAQGLLPLEDRDLRRPEVPLLLEELL